MVYKTSKKFIINLVLLAEDLVVVPQYSALMYISRGGKQIFPNKGHGLIGCFSSKSNLIVIVERNL